MTNASYTPEQLAIHQRIVDAALAGKHRAAHPELQLFFGTLRSGKASFYKKHFEPRSDTVVIRAPLFAEHPFFKARANIAHPEKLPEFVNEYYDICAKICEAAYERGCSVNWLDHAEHPKQVKQAIHLLDSYKKTLNGFYLPTIVQPIANIASRIRTGRVGDSKRGAHMQRVFIAHWQEYEKLCDASNLYTTGLTDIGNLIPATLVSQRKMGGSLEVLRSRDWEAFQAMGRAQGKF